VSDRLQDTFELWDPPQPEEREALELAVEASAAIQAYAMATLGEQAPALSGLTNGLRERVRRLPKPPEPEEEAAGPSDDATTDEGAAQLPAPPAHGRPSPRPPMPGAPSSKRLRFYGRPMPPTSSRTVYSAACAGTSSPMRRPTKTM